MGWTTRVASAALAFGLGVACAGAAAASRDDAEPAGEPDPPVCAGPARVEVGAAAPEDAETACDGARRALDFLARAGLAAPPVTAIVIVPALPGELAGRALGCCEPSTRRILLVDFDTFRAGGGWFRMPPSRELYRAVASHETAHAVVGCHSEPRRLPVAAHEYVAYVTLFATMDPPLRSAILATFPGAGFETAAQIGDLAHAVDPNRFGVASWRHDLRVRDRDGWLGRVVAGEAIPEPGEDPDASAR